MKEKIFMSESLSQAMNFTSNIQIFTDTPEKYTGFSGMRSFCSVPWKPIKKINNGQAVFFFSYLKEIVPKMYWEL